MSTELQLRTEMEISQKTPQSGFKLLEDYFEAEVLKKLHSQI